jgi:hypothetical protein
MLFTGAIALLQAPTNSVALCVYVCGKQKAMFQ